MGAGFSYVNKTNAYARDLATVVSDMIFFLKSFFDLHKEFEVSGASETAQRGARSHSTESIRCKHPQRVTRPAHSRENFFVPRDQVVGFCRL